jgi:hypothetical protein
MKKNSTPEDWYDVGKAQGIRAVKRGLEIQRYQSDFMTEDENSAWADGVLEGAISVGGQIVAVDTVLDMIPGSRGGVIQVIYVERRN